MRVLRLIKFSCKQTKKSFHFNPYEIFKKLQKFELSYIVAVFCQNVPSFFNNSIYLTLKSGNQKL